MKTLFSWVSKPIKKTKEKIPKYLSPIKHKKGKRGFAIMPIIQLIMLIPILIVMYAVLAGQGGQGGFMSILTGGELANCAGSATYNVTAPSDTMTCTIAVAVPWLVVVVSLISAVAAIVYGQYSSGSNTQGGI